VKSGVQYQHTHCTYRLTARSRSDIGNASAEKKSPKNKRH